MKKLFAVLIVFAFVFTSCENEPEPEKETTLTINNESGVYIYNVKWHGFNFGETYYLSLCLRPGETDTRDVTTGSGYVFFEDSNWNGNIYHTVDLVVVGKNENVEFTFTNNTIVKDSSGNNRPLARK